MFVRSGVGEMRGVGEGGVLRRGGGEGEKMERRGTVGVEVVEKGEGGRITGEWVSVEG